MLSIFRPQGYPHAIYRAYKRIHMTSCVTRKSLAARFATAARLYAETATNLAILGKFGIEYTHLVNQTIEAQVRSDAAFRAFTEHVASHNCGDVPQNGQGHLYARRENAPQPQE
jgi:hypothetical protein